MTYYDYTLLNALVCLAPPILYLLGKIKDPFHPLLFAGGAAFGAVCYIPLTNPDPAFRYTTANALSNFELLTMVSMLSLYWGWAWWAKRRPMGLTQQGSLLAVYRDQYDPQRMILVAWVYAMVSALIAVRTYGHFSYSGYLTALVFLEWPAAILFIQAAILDRNLLGMAIIGLPIAMTESLLRFFLYGSRFETAVFADLLLLPFLATGRRPRKTIFLVVLAGFAVVMWSMTTSRQVIGRGEATNRFSALGVAIEEVFSHPHSRYTAGKTFVFGANVTKVAMMTHFGDGSFIYNLGVHFLPKEWFPNKNSYYTDWGQTNDVAMVRRYLGMSVGTMPNGAACTGFASVFTQFGWLFPFPWFLLGIFLRHIYAGAVYLRRFNYLAYLVLTNMLVFLLIGQDIYQFCLYGFFGFVPATLAFWYCRTRQFRAASVAQPVAVAGIPRRSATPTRPGGPP